MFPRQSGNRVAMPATIGLPALLEVTDQFANRVDLLIGLRGMDPAAMDRASDVALSGFTLKVIGREDFVAMRHVESLLSEAG